MLSNSHLDKIIGTIRGDVVFGLFTYIWDAFQHLQMLKEMSPLHQLAINIEDK